MGGLTIDASIEKAILLKAHGLNDDAKRELITLIFNEDSESKNKPHAYYLLGAIAFDENRIRAATKTWNYIIEEYPDSDEALIVKERIDELSKVTLAVHTESVETSDYSLAKLYLKNADFWSEDKDTRWQIDSSWIPKVEFALKWYDKVISEFPKSDAAHIAYIGKIQTLLSWKKLDKGSEDDPLVDHLVSSIVFPIYIRQLVSTFRDFEKDFPNDITLQACRFQIGQAYFEMGILSERMGTSSIGTPSTNDLEQAKKWLEQAKQWFDEVIANSGENDTFYRQISEERNKHIINGVK